MLVKNIFNPQAQITLRQKEHQGFIADHGLEGWVLENSHFQLDDKLKAYCHETALKYLIRYEVFARECKVFLHLFPDAVPLKGMSLVSRIYTSPTQRRITDIDLYYPYDFNLIEKYFVQNGYEIHSEKWEANNFKLNASKIIEGVLVPFEIHQKLLWENHCEWKIVEKTYIKTLAPEDELIYLSGHLAFQHTFLRINWLFDIALLLNQHSQWDSSRLDYLLHQLDLKNSLSSSLWACQQFLKIDLPQNLQKYLVNDRKNRLIQQTLSEKFLIDVNQHRIRYYFLKHLLKDSLAQSINYDMLWLKQKIKNEFKSTKN